jgi:predicted nucleic acid-binding protein
MRVLLDTNILTRSFQPNHQQHTLAVGAVSSLRSRGDSLFLVPQNLYEFWVVATRPIGENGLGLAAPSARARLQDLKRSFTLLDDVPALFSTWENLVVNHGVIGKSAHDARLVAAMNLANLEGILTFNATDFGRYSYVDVIRPESV